ncbi:MAG TPA: GFA family protein [Alphaproteobacteria bacterium]|nr:GFA family protein [Alphaproteobacteria bacterium]
MKVRGGGCLCGAVRYEVSGEPTSACYCHCRICQRAAGAPVVAWAGFAGGRFRLVSGTPTIFTSSRMAERGFCARCGTTLTFRYTTPGCQGEIHIAVASLDEPDEIAPGYHIWTDSRPAWFDTADSLPRHAGEETAEQA